MITSYQGDTSIRLQEYKDDEENEEEACQAGVDYELLKSYIPAPVLNFLLDKNPLGI